jgi:hypothetical protein
VVAQTTGQSERPKNPAAVALGKLGGQQRWQGLSRGAFARSAGEDCADGCKGAVGEPIGVSGGFSTANLAQNIFRPMISFLYRTKKI